MYIYNVTVSGMMITDLYGEGQYCEEFDGISELVGTPKIKEHSDDELLESYFKGEALHLYSIDIMELCYHIIAAVIKQYKRISVRENRKNLQPPN